MSNSHLKEEQQQRLVEDIRDALGPVRPYVEISLNYIELGDLGGLHYTIDNLAKQVCAIVNSLNCLEKLVAGDGEGKQW